MPKIVTLTTDFGLRDPYVAEMKAAILSISPDVTIVDVTHGVAQFSIRMGAFVLASAAPYFPEGAIHVAVVDPGVGTRRRPILIQTTRSIFVGPDNGLLILAAEQQGMKCIREIVNIRFMLPRVSGTFHGRDVFAPVAAHLANGVAPEEFGSEIQDVIKPEFAEVTLSKGVIVGEVLHVDNFGNVITNVRANEVAGIRRASVVNVELSDRKLRLKFCRAYGEVEPQVPLVLSGSHGYFEIAVNQGNAAERFGVKPGDRIRLS